MEADGLREGRRRVDLGLAGGLLGEVPDGWSDWQRVIK